MAVVWTPSQDQILNSNLKNLLNLLKKIPANTSSRMMSYIIFPYQILSFGDL